MLTCVSNRIYRLVLVAGEDISVDRHYSAPALLQVCRKIRNEAKSIYFLEQTFRVDVTGFESKYYSAWLHKLGGDEYYGKMVKGGNLALTTIGSDIRWKPLLVWCQAFYEGSLPGCRVIDQEGRSAAEKVASRAFRFVDKLKHKLDWKEIKEILWQYRLGIEDTAAGWWGFDDEQMLEEGDA